MMEFGDFPGETATAFTNNFETRSEIFQVSRNLGGRTNGTALSNFHSQDEKSKG
jgi:hypothetical protein